MGYSKLCDEIRPPKTQKYGNKWSLRPAGAKIESIIMHHWAGRLGGDTRLVESADKASANYIIKDGKIIGSVDEKFRAWTSGSAAADNKGITIEVQNSSGAPEWLVSEANERALIKLIADIAERYSLPLTLSTLRGHREFQATSCPGPYLWGRRSHILTEASKILKSPITASKPKPTTTAPAPVKTPIKTPQTSQSDITRLANEVIAGKWGVGNERRRRLGANYNAVQKEVNRILKSPITASKPKPTTTAPAPVKTTQASAAPVLRIGSRGQAVLSLQKGLNKVFPAYSKLIADGIFGNATAKVVKEFQRRTGITQDGIVGQQTVKKLHTFGITI